MAGKSVLFVVALSLLAVGCKSRKQGYDYSYLEDQEDCTKDRLLDLDNTNHSLYGFVRVTRGSSYWPNMSCSLRVLAPRYHQLTTRIRWVDTKCEHAYLGLSGSNESSSEPTKFCGQYTPSSSWYSSQGALTFSFYSDHTDLDKDRRGFDLYYTAFHQNGCENGEFKCSLHSRCIPDEVKCDSLDNCGDWSDEYSSTCGMSTAGIVSVTIICVVVVGACVGCVIYVYYDDKKKKKERERRRQNQQVAYTVSAAAVTNPSYATPYSTSQYGATAGIGEPPPYTTYASYPSPDAKTNLAYVPDSSAVPPAAVPDPGACAAGAADVAGSSQYAPRPADDAQTKPRTDSQALPAYEELDADAGGFQNATYAASHPETKAPASN